MTADLRRLVASLLSAAAAGCATQPGGLAVAPRIVAGETPIEIRSSAGKPSRRPAEAVVPMLAGCGIYLPFCPIVVLGAGWTRRVDGASPRQLRWTRVLVILAPVLFWVLVHRRLS